MMHKPMYDKQILRHFSGVESGGVRCCKHCDDYASDCIDDMIDHLVKCKVYKQR